MPPELAISAGLGALLAVGALGGAQLAWERAVLARRLQAVRGTPDQSRRLDAMVERLLIGGGKDREEIEARLLAAGFNQERAVLVFAGARIGASLCAAAAVLLVLALLGRAHGGWLFLTWTAGGGSYIAAKRALAWSVARRQRQVTAELPFTIDAWLMMLEAGVSLDQCFRLFAQGHGAAAPAVRTAVAALVADLQRGMAYDPALDRWADRLCVPGAKELAGLFKRALAHGTEVGAALRAFSSEFTDRRISGAREAVGRKTAQMAVAMMLFFMPALFIVLAGPAVVSLLGALRGFGG